MDYSEFEQQHPDYLATVNPATRRSWAKRCKVPESALQTAKALQNGVASAKPSVAKPKKALQGVAKALQGVTNPKIDNPAVWTCVDGKSRLLVLPVSDPSPDHDIAYDLMSDNYARGYPGDSMHMRKNYRTPARIHREAEKLGVPFKSLLSDRGFPSMAER